jgi:hypothetical protein
MSHHRDELRRICRIAPDDGPFVRELKALLAPDDLTAEVVDLATRTHEPCVKLSDVLLQGGDLLFRSVGTRETHRSPTRRLRTRSRGQVSDFFAQFIFGTHASTLSRWLSIVKRRLDREGAIPSFDIEHVFV